MGTFACGQLERDRIERDQPDRRVRNLQRRDRKAYVFVRRELACEVERAEPIRYRGIGGFVSRGQIARERLPQEDERLAGTCGPVVPVGAVDAELVASHAGREPNLEPAVNEVVEHGDLLDYSNGVVERDAVSKRADP